MLEELLESLEIPIGNSKTVQVVARLIFGAVGTLLALAGIWIGLTRGYGEMGWPLRFVGICVFLFMGCFCAFNVALHRSWRWPGRALVAGFVGLFVVRIVFGA